MYVKEKTMATHLSCHRLELPLHDLILKKVTCIITDDQYTNNLSLAELLT